MNNSAPQKLSWIKRLSGYAGTVVVQIGFGLISTYIGLSVLAAEDYGLYAIISIAIGLAAALAIGPTAMITSGQYLTLEEQEKARIDTTLVLLALSASACTAILLYLLWPAVELVAGKTISPLARNFSIATIIPQTLVILYTTLNYNQGHANRVFFSTLAQGIATVLAICIGFYWLGLGEASLYFSQLAGFSAAASISVVMNRPQWKSPNADWAKRWWQSYINYTVNVAISTAPQFVESAAIAKFAGLANLAAWQHSRIYNTFILRTGKIIGLTIWPIALEEAKQDRFKKTAIAWRIVYIGFTLLGICAAFLAEPLVDFLTHGKLITASVFIPWWFVYNLLQNSGREAEATLYSSDLGMQAANSGSAGKIISLIALVPLLIAFGLAGALMAAMIDSLYYRYSMRRKARRIKPIPAIDHWAFIGCAIIVAAIALEYALAPLSLLSRCIAAICCMALTLVLARRVFIDIFSFIKLFVNK